MTMTRLFELPEGTEGKIIAAFFIALAAAAIAYVVLKLPDAMARLGGK
jgi:hypothetical protein